MVSRQTWYGFAQQSTGSESSTAREDDILPFILILPKLFGVADIYASQPAADVLTILVCVLSIPAMKRIASQNMQLGG